MSETVTAPTVAAAQASGRADVVNDFSMVVATVNGSDAADANMASFGPCSHEHR
jgi:hypothetical protein